MNLIINHLSIPFEKDGINEYIAAASKKLDIGKERLSILKILSKALDIKDKEQFVYKISLAVRIAPPFKNRQNLPEYTESAEPEANPVKTSAAETNHSKTRPAKIQKSNPQQTATQQTKTAKAKPRPIIVGFGPSGMFAALELLDRGVKPRIFERGKKIEERSTDVQQFISQRKINPESNIQFGEGGAGSYSDGKLFSRRNNNSSHVNRVLKTFVKFGAPEEIEYISKPHLGTDLLCRIVRNIRLHILERGGEINYSSKMTDILISDGAATGIVINGEKEYVSEDIFIALGHSARDTFEMLHEKGVAIEQRPISVGARIEHPAKTINLMRYGKKYCDCPELGAATYSLNHTNRALRRGVYTFCMCPGGEVVNASSSQGLMAVNGMSDSQRASRFSNAALVVPCHLEDYGSDHPLAGIGFQKKIEEKAFDAGGGSWSVPGQNLMDFIEDKPSAALNENSYKMGAVPGNIRDIFPSFVIQELLTAFDKWKTEVPLFVSDQAILLGAETRTSSPLRIKRNKEHESVNVKNLLPIGEGAGYAGGITSSAADAIRAVAMRAL